MNISEQLKKASDEAIKRGNEFEGYLGMPPEELSKEQLILICTILYDAYRQICDEVKNTLNKY